MQEGARIAALGMNTALDVAGSLLGLDVFQSIGNVWSGQGNFWDAMTILGAVNPVGKLGKVGAVLGKAGKYAAKGRQLMFHLHHVLPRFLDGLKNGTRVLLPEGLHHAYHGGLLTALAQGEVRRTGTWREFFRQNEGMLEKAHGILISYTAEFDRTHGTNLLRYVLDEVGG